MIASFPWYDLQSVQWANDRLWQSTGYSGELNRELAVSDLWNHPDLLVTQACGLDLFLADAPIEPFAAPVFELDCKAGMYYSHIVGNASGDVAAVNSLSSRSGWSALLSKCSPRSVTVTGSHWASLEALRTGKADVAAIDAVTWRIIKRDTPDALEGLKIVGRSDEAPSPPFVVRAGADPEPVMSRLVHALGSTRSANAKRALLLKGIIPVQRHHYLRVLAEYQAVNKRTGSAVR